MTPLQIFIGWDPREAVAYHVLSQSLIQHASRPISITPLVQSSLRKSRVYRRSPDKRASTEFSLTRFLVPYLCDYKGVAVFMDCDMLCQRDIYDILPLTSAAVSCVQHDYIPSTLTKMDGCRQSSYPRKNWSSVMVFNNEKCRILSPEYVNHAPPSDLHQMKWAESIYPLDTTWNWLVGEYPSNPYAALLHYTLGGPWFVEYQEGDEAGRWLAAYRDMTQGVPCFTS